MICRARKSAVLIASVVFLWAVAHGQQPAQSWFLDKHTEQTVYFDLPFALDTLSVEQRQDETRFILSISNLRQPVGLPEDSVFLLEIHTHDLVIVYTHNAPIVPGVSEDRKVHVLRRKGAILQAEGRIQFDWNGSQIVVSIPANIPIENLWGAVYRYLPSTSDMQRVAGGRPPLVDYVVLTDNPFARRYPGWPYRQNQNRLQQQRRQPNNNQGQSRQQSRGQQRVNPGGGTSPGQPVEWEPGDFVDVPMASEDASHLADDSRFRGGRNRPWDRDISIPSGDTVKDEPGVKLPGNKIINWGFEHGPFPWPGADRSDAIVGVEGTDRNNNGRLDPDEVEGVVGLCPPDGSVNSFYVDPEGYVHWENRKKGNENNERPDTHYIYDPQRDILKIYDSNGNLVYMGPPRNWGNHVR